MIRVFIAVLLLSACVPTQDEIEREGGDAPDRAMGLGDDHTPPEGGPISPPEAS